MSSTTAGSDGHGSTIFGKDGTIDLSGDAVAKVPPERPAERPIGDAWIADRDRRSLLPTLAPTAAQEARDLEELVPDDIHREIVERFALGDYAASLVAAELRLGIDPQDESAREYAAASRQRLEERYTARIGSVQDVFEVATPSAKVEWLGLDPQAAFLLSAVDGRETVADVIERSGMPRLEALRVFTELLEAKAIVRVG